MKEQKNTHQKKEFIDAEKISKIAFKTGLSPNQLIEIYQSQDKKTDIKTMVEHFDGGKGIKKIQEVQKQFEKDHKSLGKAGGSEISDEGILKQPRKQTWVDRVSSSEKQGGHDVYSR